MRGIIRRPGGLEKIGVSKMFGQLDYYGIAGDLQTKAMQFNALGSNASDHYNKEEQALKYIDDLIYDLREQKKIIKRELAKKAKQEAR